MQVTKEQIESVKKAPFTLRTLSKSGGSRYLSVGTLLPEDWKAIKVYVQMVNSKTCVLLLEQIT